MWHQPQDSDEDQLTGVSRMPVTWPTLSKCLLLFLQNDAADSTWGKWVSHLSLRFAPNLEIYEGIICMKKFFKET